jgi:hypothetical protein
MSEITPNPVEDSAIELLDPATQLELVEQQRLQVLAKELHIEVLDVSRTAVQAKAIDHGDAYIAEQTSQHGFKGVMKRIWHGNLAHDYIRQREIQHGRSTIVAERNSFALSGGTLEEHDAAMSAVVNRFTEGFLHEGESSHALDDTEPSQRLRTGVTELVRGFAVGSVTAEVLAEEKVRLLSDYGRTLSAEDRNKGLLFANNITEVAIAAKAAVANGLAVDKIDQLLSINSGEAQTGARTEARQTATDKIVNKLYSTKAGALVNETTLALGVGVVMTIGKFTTRKAATAAGAFVGLGVGAGLIAGARAHAKIGQERQLHMRQRATGGEMPIAGSAKRREAMEGTRYDTVRATDLQDRLAQARAAVDEANPATTDALLNSVCEISTRIRLSDEESKDLIQYKSETSLEQERHSLDLTLAEAKIQLMRSGVSAATITERASAVVELLRSDITDKDRVFGKLQRQQTIKMAAIGFGSGMVIGTVVQEVKAAFSDDIQGVFESDATSQDRRTLLAGIFRSHNHSVANHVAPVGNETPLNDNLSIGLPPDYHMQATSTGHYQLLGPNGSPIVDDVALDSNGQIEQSSLTALHNAGVNPSSHLEHYTTTSTVLEKSTLTPQQYLQAHPSQFTDIHRELWYDNDTTIFDKNELRLDWGGQGGSGVAANGDYQFDVKSMFPAGSFHEGANTDAQQLISSGKMAIALSMDKASQASALMIHVDTNGIATIKADSWEARSMFENRNGQAHYVGGYAEAVQLMGQNPNGGETVRSLATVVGDNQPKAAEESVSNIVLTQHDRTVMDMNIVEKSDLPVEIPFPIPVYGRRGLESLREQSNLVDPNLGGMYYGGMSLEQLQQWLKVHPEMIQQRSLAISEDGSKRWIEADGSEVMRDVAREREILSGYLDRERESDPEHFNRVVQIVERMPKMNNQCRVAVNIPAWMEAKNLNGLLTKYMAQVDHHGDPLDLNLFEINILINRKAGTPGDDSVAVIDNFIAAYQATHGVKPPVNYYDIEIKPPDNNVGYARKLLTDAISMRSIKREEQSAALYYETEDADLTMVDPRTILNVITKMDAKPHLDAVRGLQDRDPQSMVQNDFLLLRRRTWDFFELLARNKKFRDPQNPSWNFTWNRVVTGGWNTAYSAEAYALIGGYEKVVAGEDMSIGEKITMVRGNGTLPNLEVIGLVPTASDSSPRRFIHEILTDKGAYEKFEDEDANKIIREKSVDEALSMVSRYARLNKDNEQAFQNYISNVYGWAQDATPTPTDAEHLSRRMLHMLGFKTDDYVLNNRGITVNNWENVKNALEGYRTRRPAATPFERYRRLPNPQ